MAEEMKNMVSAWKRASHCFLTACPREDFAKHFTHFNSNQEEYLYKLYTQVMVAAHQHAEEEFLDILQEAKVMDMLNDSEINKEMARIMSPDCIPSEVVLKDRIDSKQNEIELLRHSLQEVEKQNSNLLLQIAACHKEMLPSDGITIHPEELLKKLEGTNARLSFNR